MSSTKKSKNFKPKAHILKLLGEELIKSPILAIYELIKNSYDADSTFSKVAFKNISAVDAEIWIEDNGSGLTSNVIDNVWLEPGTDHRKPIGKDGERIINRSPLFNRVPMGEKGVGRFAVHKLGNKIELITRPSRLSKDEDGQSYLEPYNYEIHLTIDWSNFSQSKYLEDIPIEWVKLKNINDFYFKNRGGTLIKIGDLKEQWSRRMARSLKRYTVSMLSPKRIDTKFNIELDFENEWLDKFPDAATILSIAPYQYTGLLDIDFNLTVDYKFELAINDRMGIREMDSFSQNIAGKLRPKYREILEEELYTEEQVEEKLNLIDERKNPFGNILVEIYSYDLDSTSLKDYTYDSKTLKRVLKDHAGIKVYKDDMRVFDYGDPGNDWQELGLRRVQNKKWFSNNQIISFVYLDSEESTGLIEKTNREGFIENEEYVLFHQCISLILEDFQAERFKDRTKWRNFNAKVKTTSYSQTSFIDRFKSIVDSTELSDAEKRTRLKEEADKLEKDFEEKKETLLIPAGVGMTASVALHEIEKLVPRMREIVKSNPFKREVAIDQVDELDEYLSGILSVLRKGGNQLSNLSELLNRAISNYKTKLKNRNIEVNIDADNASKPIKCDKRYFVTMIMNLLDNSMYWLDTVNRDSKVIDIKVSQTETETVIVISDNGPGFRDNIEDLVRPFFSRKSDGIGIGLYLIDTIMMKYGKLEIFNSNDYNPEFESGATVKLTFKNL